jgi:Protein of unknown function (DUF1326)
MTKYDISGTFYEACDCEVICSCWAGLEPDMGSCTGLFAWHISKGVVGTIDVSDSKVVVLSQGKSCDDSQNMMVLIDGDFNALKSAFETDGSWHDIFSIQPGLGADQSRLTEPAKITMENNKITVKSSNITAVHLSFTTKEAYLIGANTPAIYSKPLIDRVVGDSPDKLVTVGVVNTPTTPIEHGLNLLADIPKMYRFDLDVSQVSAMRGSFNYVN